MTDVRALLLTDVVGSATLTESLGPAAASALWQAHDRIARDLLPAWHGREIDKSDGFLLLFADAAQALGYASAYHQAIATLVPPLEARAGIDVGPVILRENEASDVRLGAKPVEVEGIAKSLAARAMAVAGGGQTLLTANAARELGEGRVALHSHGHWRMKGMADPVELFEAGENPTRPSDAEKAYRVVLRGDLWLPEREVKHGLPAERDAFVGRSADLRRLDDLFEGDARLVSILGIGGSGKTRLALRFAWSSLGDFPGGPWFCDLSGARTVDGVVNAVATALDVPLGRGDGIAQLGNAIAGRGRCLIILDNFEQVSRHAPETLGPWLDRAVDARFLVTTRDVLGMQGEHVLPLSPLPSRDAAALFVRRAQAAGRAIGAAPGEESTILSLVKLLDGLPLAIELAAARARILSPQALLDRMNERFTLLASTSQRRDRQATLRSTFDWSWDLLSTADKAALARLSVFERGFTLEAAEAVLPESSQAMAVVQSLVDKSFVRAVPGERFEMLVSVQEYAAEHLRTAGRFEGSGPAALEDVRRRHVEYFSGLGETRAILSRGEDLDNLILACRHAVERKMPEAVGALEGAWGAIRLRGPYGIAVELGLGVRDAAGGAPDAIARIERVIGSVLTMSGEIADGADHLQLGLQAARDCGNEAVEATILCDLALIALADARLDDARGLYQDALDFAATAGNDVLEWSARQGLSHVAKAEGRFDTVETQSGAALGVARRLGDRRREGLALGDLAVAYSDLGRIEEATALFEQTLAAAVDLGDRKWEGNTLCNLGFHEQLQGRSAESARHLERALQLSREIGYPVLECVALCNLGIAHDALGDWPRAAEHVEAALTAVRELGERRYEAQFLVYLARIRAHQGRVEDARTALDASEAILAGSDDRFAMALLLCTRAEIAQLAPDPSSAARFIAQAQAITRALGAGGKSELGIALASLEARQASIGPR